MKQITVTSPAKITAKPTTIKIPLEPSLVNENGTGVSKDLAFGSYKIKERVPDGWVDKHVVYNVKFTWLQGMTETNLKN